jgi:hypothetical protein
MYNAAFYLIINLAVGGTSGWFPDKVGNKPWFDSSLSAFLFPSFLVPSFAFSGFLPRRPYPSNLNLPLSERH